MSPISSALQRVLSTSVLPFFFKMKSAMSATLGDVFCRKRKARPPAARYVLCATSFRLVWNKGKDTYAKSKFCAYSVVGGSEAQELFMMARHVDSEYSVLWG